MPTDGNGVYSLPLGYLATAGLPVLPSQHNPIFEDVASAITGRLAVNGANPMTGPLRLADGVVGAPSLTFANATTTGFYKTTAGFAAAIGGVKVVEFGAGGIIQGSRYIGEIFAWTGSTAPALCVLPYGQTLTRAAYPDLWTFAQVEIAAGNTFYNNGNGSTTFGIGDCRGRVLATKDNMGGSAAGRLTATTMAPNGNTIGAVSGNNQTVTLGLGEIPAGIGVTGSLALSISNVLTNPNAGFTSISYQAGATAVVGVWSNGAIITQNSGVTASGNLTSYNTGGGAHLNVQPTIITSCALFAGA